MAVPFSNTHLRVPRGFGNLLEGLAKEVLRDQPEDIPTFAAIYFNELLKAREESGLDPAEWGAKLEDRFYNSHAFKETATQGNSSSPKANMRNKPDDSKTFGNNETLHSISKDLNINTSSDDTEVKQIYELDKKLDEESGETEHGLEIPYVGRADVDVCAQEVKDPSVVQEQSSENTEPTPLPSFGGLANVDVCAEEINPALTELSEATENSRDLESPKSLLPGGQQSESQDVPNSTINQLTESFIETPSHIEHDTGKQADDMSYDENTEEPKCYGHIEDSEQGVSEITDELLEDTGPEEKSTEKVYLEESAERTIALEKDKTETRTTSLVEAGEGTEEHIEEKDELLDREIQETNHEYSSTNEFVEGETAAETTSSPSDINSRSLMEMKDTYFDYSDEIYDSKSEVIDVLDEVVMGTDQCPAYSGEHEDAMVEEDHLESQTDAPEPDTQLNDNDSDTEVTEDVTGNEILNTDIMDTSEKDLVTENVNEGSDLDSDGCDADEIDHDIGKEEKDQTKSMTFDDLSKVHEQDAIKTDDRAQDSDLKEDVLTSETEKSHHRPLSELTEKEAEVITNEHPTEAQEQWEQNENTETDKDQGDEFEDQKDKNQESKLHSEIQENPESSEKKEECGQPQEEEDIMDIPLDDPEANKAAAKIQAGFRGHMTRKKMKPGEKPSEEVSSSGEALNGSQGDTGGTDGVETDATSGPEQ